MIDFCKHKKGDTVYVHCCDTCAHDQGVIPKSPPDSGVTSLLCDVCGHNGIGSTRKCIIGDYLVLRIQWTSQPHTNSAQPCKYPLLSGQNALISTWSVFVSGRLHGLDARRMRLGLRLINWYGKNAFKENLILDKQSNAEHLSSARLKAKNASANRLRCGLK